MADSPARSAAPAGLPTGRDRATRVREIRAVLEQSASSSAYRPPVGPAPARHHVIVPEACSPGDGYRCAVCLLPIGPGYDGGPSWRHSPPWDLA